MMSQLWDAHLSSNHYWHILPWQGETGIDIKGLFHFYFLEFVDNWLPRWQLLGLLRTLFPYPLRPPQHKHLRNKNPIGSSGALLSLNCKFGLDAPRVGRMEIGRERLLSTEKSAFQNWATLQHHLKLKHIPQLCEPVNKTQTSGVALLGPFQTCQRAWWVASKRAWGKNWSLGSGWCLPSGSRWSHCL